MVGRLAFIVAYGPEARAFLQSGLARRLAREREIVVAAAEPDSIAFADCPYPVAPLPCLAEGPAMLRLRAWGRGLRRRAPRLRVLALAAERAAGRGLGGGSWARFFAEHSIGAVVAASAGGARTLPALQGAANRGLPSVVLLNSWKDLRKRAELPVPLSAVGVVTEAELALLPGGGVRAAVCGSLHQAAVRRAPAMSRVAFCGALGLSPRLPILCYAAALRDLGEAARLEWLAAQLPALPRSPQLVIRPNPMDDDASRYRAFESRDGIAVLRPRWEWCPEREWNCPLPEDLHWWRAALEHCAAAITLPSTIALDFAAWGKPALNVAWGAGAASWIASGHAAVRLAPGARAAASPERLLQLIEDALRQPPALPCGGGDPVEAAAALIERACANEAARRSRRRSALEATAP